MNRTLLLVIAVAAAVVIGVAGYFTLSRPGEVPPAPVIAPAPPPAPAPAAQAPAIEHPIDESALAREAPAPEAVELDHSDAAMRAAMADVFAGHALPSFLHLDRIIRSLVATVDALPRDSVSPTVMPVDPVPGRMAVAQGEGRITLAADNDLRYAPYVAVLKGVDARRAAALYVHHYPLFQQAYRELGYPNGYFNDRLVRVIDMLLATPEVEGPIELAQPKVVYVFADPKLESLPAGQKILLRLGRDNAAAVRAKLREFRAQIVRAAPKP